MKRLEGKNAIISGAASGVGRAASLLFARKGTAVACVDIDARTGAVSAAIWLVTKAAARSSSKPT
jgi:NAD(P)-dependent dehydrogenase (short-subunit alcohol dehydrogenase family)